MLNDFKRELELVSNGFTDKEVKKMRIKSLLNLSEKLLNYEDGDIEPMMYKIKDMINDYTRDDDFDFKHYKKAVTEVKQRVQSKFDLRERGTVSSQYVGIGIALGTGIGVAFISINPAMMSIFSALGIVFGSSIGRQKESEYDKNNKLY